MLDYVTDVDIRNIFFLYVLFLDKIYDPCKNYIIYIKINIVFDNLLSFI